ncbi:heme-binding domain-containing protein [Meiothermus rufus]|uniref:heme-binding domain-containing protein n=1 Tax=Meiothermus rufus TaxID=604332 RepID=UPI000410F697|nr:heme-binding domain-containing protein [Meiothermus rufus]
MKVAHKVLVGLAVGLLGIQLIPYGRNHTNPPVLAEPAWDSPRTREIFFRACADCHSNQTVWPWYSHIAPISWLIERDVLEGRAKFNVSEWTSVGGEGGEDAAETVQEGSMPPWLYTLTHPRARLSGAEKQAFIRGLMTTFGGEGSTADSEGRGEPEEQEEEHHKEGD